MESDQRENSQARVSCPDDVQMRIMGTAAAQLCQGAPRNQPLRRMASSPQIHGSLRSRDQALGLYRPGCSDVHPSERLQLISDVGKLRFAGGA